MERKFLIDNYIDKERVVYKNKLFLKRKERNENNRGSPYPLGLGSLGRLCKDSIEPGQDFSIFPELHRTIYLLAGFIRNSCFAQ